MIPANDHLPRTLRAVALGMVALALGLALAGSAAAQKPATSTTPKPAADAGTKPAQEAPARAKPSKRCAQQIINDWFPDQRLGVIYAIPCYRAAIKKLPKDVVEYTDARQDILRALQFARKGKADPGRPGPKPTETTDTTDTTGGGGTGTPGDPPAPDTSGPSSIPVPLIVLGGLAVLLLAAGGAGYLSRRLRSEAEGDGDASAAS